MKTILYYIGILKLIQKTQLKVSLIILHNQVLNYRKNVEHFSGLSEEIRLTIKHLIQGAVLNIHDKNRQKKLMNNALLANKSNHPVPVHVIDSKELGELARYFKERHNKEIFNSIGDKLEKSTVDHLHEAIRYARQGDERNAHMHADIASSSCEELSHFIDKELYHDFVGQMKVSLESFKAAIK